MASVTLNPSAYVSLGASTGTPTISNQTNPVGKGSSNTTYAQLTTVTTTNSTSYAFWKFDCSSIPSTATIDSVSCVAKIGASSTSTTRSASRSVQLYNGTSTAKGSSVSWTASTSGSTATISAADAGTWTRSELDNIHIRIESTRGTSTQAFRIYFYGADLTINYTEAKVQYTVTISSTGNGTTSPTGAQTVEEGNSLNITLTPSTDYTANVTDNGTDVTNSLVANGSSYTYSLSNVSANHTVNVTYVQLVKYTINSSITNGTLMSPAETVQVNSGSSVEFSFKGDDKAKFVSMTVNDVPVTPTKSATSQDSTAATWSVSTNYDTYSTYVISNVNSDTSSYFWSNGAQTAGKYVLFTFNKLINLTAATFYSSNSTDYPNTCNKLQCSADGNTWTDLGTFQASQTSTFTGLNAQKIKYVRIYADSTISNWLVLNTATFTYTTPAITAGYSYTLSNIDGDKTVVITFAGNNKVTVKIGGTWKTGTPYKKVNGTWETLTPKELATYLEGKTIIKK